MSGCSDNSDCPRCKGKNTLEVYSDWKPFDMTTGSCARCGFYYNYRFARLTERERKELSEGWEDKEALKEVKRKITKEEKENIKEFDKNFGVEK